MSKKGILLTTLLLALIGFIALLSPSLLTQHNAPQQRILFSDNDFYHTTIELQVVEEPIHPIPKLKPLSTPLKQRVDLGRRLFNDPRLSGNGEISCSTCHNLAIGGHDPRGISIGIRGTVLRRNTPTVLNSAFNATQFWDGRAKTLFEQAAHPMLNPEEMGASWESVLQRLKADPEMVKQFSIYPDGITARNIQDAIALFERTLITPDSPFDRYLKGEEQALSTIEKEGYALFKSLGCISCHQGRNVGGTLFQRIGVYATDTQLQQLEESDQGRFEVTGDPTDRLVFKVPSLRNVALTAPYFHNGSRTTLEQAVADMGRLQLGQKLSSEQIEKLTAFLHTLTGEGASHAPGADS